MLAYLELHFFFGCSWLCSAWNRPSRYLLSRISFATWTVHLTVESLKAPPVSALYSTVPLCPPEDPSIFNPETTQSIFLEPVNETLFRLLLILLLLFQMLNSS